MSFKKPTSISQKWWKKYVPNSLPRNKVIEENLKFFEKMPSSLGEKGVEAAFAQSKSITDIGAEAVAIFKKSDELLQELKRFHVIVTKDKQSHKDFASGVDTMINLVKNDLKNIKEVLAREKNAVAVGKKTESQTVTTITASEDKVIKIGKLLGQYKRDLSHASDPKQLSEMVSHTHWVEPAVKNLLRTAKQYVSKLNGPATDANDALNGFTLQAKSVVADSRQLEKLLAQKCIEQFGDTKGKKLFIASKPKEPSL